VVTEDPASLAAQLAQLRQENEQLRASLHQSSQTLELLNAERDQLLEELQRRTREMDGLQHQLQYLLRRLFGRSSEKVDSKQLLLFNELLQQLAPETPAVEPVAPEAPATSKPNTNGHGRRRLPANLERRQVIHDLPEEEKPCPCCGKMRHVIGRETSEQLDYVPAKLAVIEHVRLKYACPACEANAAPGGPQIATAEKPLSPIEKGLAAPGLLAYVIVSKYGDHLPLHRLEKILQRHGIEIARSTMCDWAAQCADVLDPLYRRMIEQVLGSKVIHTDDTPVDVLDRSLNQTRTGRFWVYLGDKEHPFTVFTYTPSRSRDGPMQFLKDWGKDEPVYLQADAFGGYDGIYCGEAGGAVTEVACWAHARRKFYDARTSDVTTSTQALAYIRLLYDVEDQAKQSAERAETDLVSERYRLRQESTVPRLQQFKGWLESQQAPRGGSVLPKSPMGQAITYALNQWDALSVYTTDGRLAIDNNAAENALRRVAVGRKNWLFCGSDNGGNTAAILFSLIATCQRHKVDPFAYLRDVLARIAATPVSQLDQLLPDRWQSDQVTTTPAS
jgi:transposase